MSVPFRQSDNVDPGIDPPRPVTLVTISGGHAPLTVLTAAEFDLMIALAIVSLDRLPIGDAMSDTLWEKLQPLAEASVTQHDMAPAGAAP